jgi:putative ABC transport system ATP-binding protein
MTIEDLLRKFASGAGEEFSNDRILLSSRKGTN